MKLCAEPTGTCPAFAIDGDFCPVHRGLSDALPGVLPAADAPPEPASEIETLQAIEQRERIGRLYAGRGGDYSAFLSADLKGDSCLFD